MRALLLLAAVAMSGCYASNVIEGTERGDRLRRIVLRSESGESLFVRWYDPVLDTECGFRVSVDGRVRCEPFGVSSTPVYLDDACTEAAYEAAPGCERPEYVSIFTGVAICERPSPSAAWTLHRLGDRVEVADLFRRNALGCERLDAAGAEVYPLVPLDLDTLVGAEIEPGSGAWVVEDRLVADDGSTQPFELRDTRRGARCTLPWQALVGRGDRAPCLPEGTATIIEGGASCIETWAYGHAGSECRAEPELAIQVASDVCGALGPVEVYAVGAPIPEADRVFGEECGASVSRDEDLYRVTGTAEDAVPWLERVRHGTGRIQRLSLGRGDLSFPIGLYDAELETECLPLEIDGELRCVPGGLPGLARGPSLYVDDACTQLGAHGGPCRSEWLLETAPSSSCPRSPVPIVAVHRVGALAAGAYRIDETGACVPDDERSAHHLERVPLSRFARIERVVE